MKSIREYIRNLSYDCYEARNAAGKWFRNLWFDYIECYTRIRAGDVFVVKTNNLLAYSTGDIVVAKNVYWKNIVVITGVHGDTHLERLRKQSFKKVRRSSVLGLKAMRDAAGITKAIKEYADDLQDIAKSLRQQYEATRTIGYLYQAREMEEALRILKEYFPEVLK